MDHCTSIDDARVAKINDNTKLKDPSTDIIHAQKLCRLCAHHTDKVAHIFGEPGLEQHLAGKINAYLPVTATPYARCSAGHVLMQLRRIHVAEHLCIGSKKYGVNKSDVLPKQLCINCINKLHIISDFAENCLKAEEQLKRNMEPKILKSRSIKSDVTLLNNNIINVDKAVPQSFNDSTEVFTENYKPMLLMSNNSILPCPLCCDGKMTMTYQKSDKVMENSYREKFGSNIHLGENVAKTKIASSSSFNNSIELLDSNNESEIQCDLTNTNEMWESKIVDVTSIDFQDENTSTDLTAHACHNENIRENKKNESNKESNIVLCQICNKTFPSTETCIDHCKGHFPSQKTCHICHFQFDCEDHWLDHIRQHILNTHLQVHDHFLCQDCNQLFETLAAFSVHACPYKQYEKCDNVDDIVEETSDTFPCDTNSNGFQTIVTNNKKYIVPEELASSVKIQSKGKLSCQYCMGSFSEKSDFTSHMQTAHPDSTPQYACEICDEKFQNQFVLQYHYASHVNLSSLQCVFCSLTFTTQTSLQQHLLSQHPKLIPLQPCYKCNTCHETYTNLNDSVTHISTHLPNNYEQNHEIEEVHISQLYMCEYCESCFMVKSLLYQHYFTHSKDSRYVCKTCNSTFTSYGRLSKHKSLHNEQNKSNVTNSADILTVVKLFVCQECEKCYTQWNSLNNHRRNCHQNTHSYTCKICHESFNLYAEYQDHRKIHPAQVKTESEVFEKEYLCDYCQKTFHHHSTLALHQRIHLKGQPYTCEICGETFRLKSTYNKHFLKHTGVKPYICDVCGKGFTQNSGLYTHRRVHTGEKPYACDLCGKKFRLKHDRDNHRRCHTGERPYQCTYCGKAFRTSHDHRQHLLIHTGQRPYRCDYCSKGFRRINGLNVHKRIHTGEKPYGCAICGRHFTQKGDMMKHCKTQHGNTF